MFKNDAGEKQSRQSKEWQQLPQAELNPVEQ